MEEQQFREEVGDEVSGLRISMARRSGVSGEAGAMPPKTEAAMEAVTFQNSSKVTFINTCAHQRLIDEVLTRDGKRTGKVRCLECGEVIADPYRGVK